MSLETKLEGRVSVALSAVPGDRVLVLMIPGVSLGRDAVLGLLEAAAIPDAGGLHVCHGVDSVETYAYVAWPADGEGADAFAASLGARYPGSRAVVMEVIQAVEGASAGDAAHWHYVVETDVAADGEDDFNAWYREEHLPGLAAVPGTVRTLRLSSPTAAPRYHALYLLETRATFGLPPWLAIRATPWSSRVRPNFRNTKRTMFTIDLLEDKP